MGKNILTPYFEESKVMKKGDRKKRKKKASKIVVEAKLDINQLLAQYGEEVQRRMEAEMKLRSVQMDKAANALDVTFEEVEE